eukprot:s2020_g5.t2
MQALQKNLQKLQKNLDDAKAQGEKMSEKLKAAEELSSTAQAEARQSAKQLKKSLDDCQKLTAKLEKESAKVAELKQNVDQVIKDATERDEARMREIKQLRDKSENELKSLREKSDNSSKDAETLRQRQLEEASMELKELHSESAQQKEMLSELVRESSAEATKLREHLSTVEVAAEAERVNAEQQQSELEGSISRGRQELRAANERSRRAERELEQAHAECQELLSSATQRDDRVEVAQALLEGRVRSLQEQVELLRAESEESRASETMKQQAAQTAEAQYADLHSSSQMKEQADEHERKEFTASGEVRSLYAFVSFRSQDGDMKRHESFDGQAAATFIFCFVTYANMEVRRSELQPSAYRSLFNVESFAGEAAATLPLRHVLHMSPYDWAVPKVTLVVLFEKTRSAVANVPATSPVCIPLAALCIGLPCRQIESLRTPAQLAVYFGAQTGMLLFAKVVISSAVVSEELGLHGLPGAFLMTAIHQMICFVLFGAGFVISWMTPWTPASITVLSLQIFARASSFQPRHCQRPYRPKPLTKLSDIYRILLFSAAFAANIGRWKQFLPLSMNLIIRSCLPIATAIVQVLAHPAKIEAKGALQHKQEPCLEQGFTRKRGDMSESDKGLPLHGQASKEILCMLAGVACAALATLAQSQAQRGSTGNPDAILTGVLVCVVSIFAGALNMDMTFYMGLPSALMLLVPSFALSHPSWPGQPSMTDFEVHCKVYDLAPGVLGLAMLVPEIEVARVSLCHSSIAKRCQCRRGGGNPCGSSARMLFFRMLLGVFAAWYNVTQYSLVHSMSATYTTFAGNFNKATAIVISLAVGLEKLPEGVWGHVMLLATLGNIGSFTVTGPQRPGCFRDAASAAEWREARSILEQRVQSLQDELQQCRRGSFDNEAEHQDALLAAQRKAVEASEEAVEASKLAQTLKLEASEARSQLEACEAAHYSRSSELAELKEARQQLSEQAADAAASCESHKQLIRALQQSMAEQSQQAEAELAELRRSADTTPTIQRALSSSTPQRKSSAGEWRAEALLEEEDVEPDGKAASPSVTAADHNSTTKPEAEEQVFGDVTDSLLEQLESTSVLGSGRLPSKGAGAPETAGHEEVAQLWDRINYLEKRCRNFQKKLDARPIIYQAPTGTGPLNLESGSAASAGKPNWEPWLRDVTGPVARRLNLPQGSEQRVAAVAAPLCQAIEAPLRSFTQRLLRQDRWLWVFYAHLLVLYAIAASCIARNSNPVSPAECVDTRLKQLQAEAWKPSAHSRFCCLIYATQNGWKLPILFEELQYPYDWCLVDFGKNEQRSAEFLKINPNGRIPALIDRECNVAVAESGAILEYVCDTLKSNLLPPKDANLEKHLQCKQWLYWQVSALGPMMGQSMYFNRIAATKGDKDSFSIARFGKEAERCLQMLDDQLAESRGPFLFGDEVSAVDVACFAYAASAYWAYIDIGCMRKLQAWLQHLHERPSFKTGLTIPFARPAFFGPPWATEADIAAEIGANAAQFTIQK